MTGCIFFRKTCAIRFLMSLAFQKAKFYQNLTSESGSKQRFSLLQAKAVIQAVWLSTQQLVLKPSFRPKGRALGMIEKSENFNSLRPILFELCKKKLQGGGSNWHPPTAVIGLKPCKSCIVHAVWLQGYVKLRCSHPFREMYLKDRCITVWRCDPVLSTGRDKCIR